MGDSVLPKLAPIQLRDVWFTGVRLVPTSIEDAEDTGFPSLEIVSKSSRDGDERQWVMEFTLTMDGTLTRFWPVEGQISLVGKFMVVDGYPEEAEEGLVKAYGSAILYSEARTMYASISSRLRNQSAPLPLVDLRELGNQETSKELIEDTADD